MKIGWIDFSKDDRDRVLKVLDQFSVKGATDELGIGTVRDAFANFFFPGTSTVQTRAKYFFIVSNLLQEVAAERGEVNDKLESLAKKEYEHCKEMKKYAISLAISLAKKKQERYEETYKLFLKKFLSGIIGHSEVNNSNNYKDWVKRKPSDIYWSGIKTLGFFNTDLFKDEHNDSKGRRRNSSSISISVYLRLATAMYKEKESMKKVSHSSEDSEGNSDDKSIPLDKFKKYWNWSPTPNWADNHSIELTEEEAKFLSSRIELLQHQWPDTSKDSDTVYKILLQNWPENEDNQDKDIQSYQDQDSDSDKEGESDDNGPDFIITHSKFPKVVNIVYRLADDTTQKLLDYALKFEELVYSARVAYNLIYRKKALEKAKDPASEEKVKKALDEVQTEWDTLYKERDKLYNQLDGHSERDRLYKKFSDLKEFLHDIAAFNLDEMFTLLELEFDENKPNTPFGFLKKLIDAYQSYNIPDDFQQIENVLIEREQGLKNERAKLSNPSAEDIDWIGGKHLDYRAGTAWRIITDIKNAQKNN